MPTLKPGMRVMIYEDPITKRKPEGMATLHHDETGSHGARMDNEATWSVIFDADRADADGTMYAYVTRYVRTFDVADVQPAES